jgi:pyruvate/2-oxoglutarate dehydrogenase complex dihydrolipoamide acyltransferase (E2) component
MMNEARPFASLSSGLLARKGAAKPAMRPQGYNGGSFEDLGWDDMGPEPEEDLPEHVPSSIAALTPAPKHPHAADHAADAEPEVVAQQRAIAESYEAETSAEADAEPAPEPAPAPAKTRAEVVELPQRTPAAVSLGRKAAFTLRVDAERHLRLRLATAVTGRSAQQIVTEALDRLLASLPEVEALAERVPASGGGKS